MKESAIIIGFLVWALIGSCFGKVISDRQWQSKYNSAYTDGYQKFFDDYPGIRIYSKDLTKESRISFKEGYQKCIDNNGLVINKVCYFGTTGSGLPIKSNIYSEGYQARINYEKGMK